MIKILIIGFTFLALAAWKPGWFSLLLKMVEKILGKVGLYPRLAILLIFCLSFAFNAGLTRFIGKASPHIHDEFANLLAADTFAHGRLVTPPHPLWQFFESIHVVSHPFYASKYPPAQGFMLAIGQCINSEPITGMWLSVALACAALYWALLAWMPARWALLGGALACFHPVLLKWAQVYWGGAEAFLGGALLLGAFKRLLSRISSWDACLLSLGMILLATSRPFEGLVFTLILISSLVFHIFKRRAHIHIKDLQNLVLPVACIMGFYCGFQAFYNMRITGDPIKLPYMVYEDQYAVAPFLVWQKPRPEPRYNHQIIRSHFLDYALKEYQDQQSMGAFVSETYKKLKRLGRDYLVKFTLIIPCLALPWIWRRGGWFRFAVAGFCSFLIVIMQETWMWDRYAAPGGALLFLLVILGIRHLALWRCFNKPFGRALVVLLLLACLGQTALWLKLRRWENHRKDWDWQRLQMIRDLKTQGGKHVVIVRYGPKQSVHDDWVHNAADIDASAVVWARDMGQQENKKLLDYFKGRKFWLLESELPTAELRDRMNVPPQSKLVPYH